MTTTGGPESEPVPGELPLHPTVIGCVIVAAVSIFYLHIVGATAVDPFGQTISDYVVVPGGYALVGLSALALAVAGLVVAVGLVRSGLPHPRLPAGLLVSWSAALVVVAAFPTNAPGTPPDLVADVHRSAGAWVFIALPLVGWLTARRARMAAGWAASAVRLARWSTGAGLLSVALLTTHLPLVLGGDPNPLLGGVERVLNVVLVVLLVVTAQAVRLAVHHAATPVAAGRADVEIGEVA